MNGDSNTTVINTDHLNNGVWHWDASVGFILMMALRKLIAPGIEETPTKRRGQNCKRDGSSPMSSVSRRWSSRRSACHSPSLRHWCEWDRGWEEPEASVTGEAVLGALVISETSQLPKPPVTAGITVKEKTDEGVGCHCCVVDSGVSEPCSGVT